MYSRASGHRSPISMIKKLLLVLFSIALAGCTPSAQDIAVKDENGVLPAKAKVIRQLGNNWLVFEVEGRKYIYRSFMYGFDSSTEVLAPWTDTLDKNLTEK